MFDIFFVNIFDLDPLPFGDEAGDSMLIGDDITSPALESPTLLQFGNGLSGGFHEVYVST